MIIVLCIMSLMLLCWVILLFGATNDDWLMAARGKILNNRVKIDKLRQEEHENRKRLAQYYGVSGKFMKHFIKLDQQKEIKKLITENEKIRSGNLSSVFLLEIPGYVLLRKIPNLTEMGIYRKLRSTFFELHGKKYPDVFSRCLLAQMASYGLLCSGAVLALGTVVMIAADQTAGIGIMTVGLAITLLLVYALYDEVADTAKKRRDSISRQFPNVVSKLALLVTSGMIMDSAWKQTAWSGEGELYRQMRKAADELDQLVAPEEVYGAFIDRCNTKETAKLASAILQNLSKGNAQIGVLLKQMAEEAWIERRNMAKRDSEAANSKLMFPTMLLFGSIMVMLMVPVVMSFLSM